MHKHKCSECGCVWQHTDLLQWEEDDAVHTQAHTCPDCGNCDGFCYFHYTGEQAPRCTCHHVNRLEVAA